MPDSPDHTDIRSSLVQLCNDLGFPPPQPDDGLAEWADESLDTLLFRGSTRWQIAHGFVVEAFEAATLGQSAIAAELLTKARDFAKAARPCSCERRGATLPAHGKEWCIVCTSVVPS